MWKYKKKFRRGVERYKKDNGDGRKE